MGRGSGSASHEAVTRDQLRRAQPGVKPAWADGNTPEDPRWQAAKQSKRLLVPPAEGQTVDVDASVLAGAIAEMRAQDPVFAAHKGATEAWQMLLKRIDRQPVTVIEVRARAARFSDGRTTKVLTPRDDVYVINPVYAGDRPIKLRALHLGLARMDGLPIDLGDPAA